MPAQGLPFAGSDPGPGPKFFTIEKFKGINTKAKRPAIDDQEFSWLENMMPIGDGNLQAMYSNGSSIYTAPGGTTIIYFYFYNIGSTTYAAVFLDDGTATQVNTLTQAQTVISSNPGQFFPGSAALNNPAPACAQFGQSGLIIVSTSNVNGYYAWDGTLYPPGSASPSWLNGLTPTTMATDIAGTCVETFLSRVWVGDGAEFSNSAPSNGASFSGALGGGTTPSSDSFLRREFTQIKQANGFLYLFADSSVNVVSNVQTGGSPVATTFNNQNVDPQVGTPWHNSVQAFGRGLVFGNQSGIYALYGGAAEKVSDALDGILENATATLASDSTVDQPSGAVMTINDIRVYMTLLPVNDPFTGLIRLALACWDGKKWWLASQDKSLTFVGSQEINSVLQAWGTDGTDLFPLFTTPSDTLRKIWQTRLWPGSGFQVTKQSMRIYTEAQDNSGSGYTITGTLDYLLENSGLSVSPTLTINSAVFAIIWVNNSNGVIQWQNNSSQNIYFTVGGLSITGSGSINVSARGSLLGLTMQSTSPDFTVVAQSVLYQDASPLGA